ncbi:MAG: DNA polymerase III subunit [Ignavibacteriaceae bacterium]
MELAWNRIYGQEHVKELLNKIISSTNIPHSFLFKGIEGCGKDYTAFKFAEIINSQFIGEESFEKVKNHILHLSEPYIKYIIPLPRGKNEIESSTGIEKLSNDEILVLRDQLEKKIQNPYYKISIPKANNIKVTSIRDIRKFISFSYTDIKYRFIIISDAHLMNDEAQNALLKNLEEPPPGVIFVLITPFPDLLRETIISRCWAINFHPLSNADLTSILVNNFEVDETLSKEIAPFAGGSVLNAINLINNDFKKLLEKTISFLRYSLGRKYNSAFEELSFYLSDNDPDSIKLLIQMVIIWLNDLQKYRVGYGNLYFFAYEETFYKFNKGFPSAEINILVEKLNHLSSLISKNVNLNVLALNLIFDIARFTILK